MSPMRVPRVQTQCCWRGQQALSPKQPLRGGGGRGAQVSASHSASSSCQMLIIYPQMLITQRYKELWEQKHHGR